MKRQNEVNAVDAALQIVQVIAGGRYIKEKSPDDENSQRKEVDYILRPESQNQPWIAIEHTIVEAFKGQMTYVNRSYDIVEQIKEQCNNKLPTDRYYILAVPHELIDSLRKKLIDKFVQSVVPWIISTVKILKIDDYKSITYEQSEILLICGGSHPDINGTIGRIPRRPNKQEELSEQSLWLAIEHGLGKFLKYKKLGFETVLCMQDISGEVHSSMLMEIEKDAEKKRLISSLVDYIIVFASNEDRMIVGNVWKEKELRHELVPFSRRFGNHDGKWAPFECI